jgi:hypothetical protein
MSYRKDWISTNDEITGGRNPEDRYRYSDDELKEIVRAYLLDFYRL